jgi:hypothetical protein
MSPWRRHQRHIIDRSIEWSQIGNIQTAVQSCQRPRGHWPKHREMKVVDVEMEYVKLARPLAHVFEHQHIVGIGVSNRRIKP